MGHSPCSASLLRDLIHGGMVGIGVSDQKKPGELLPTQPQSLATESSEGQRPLLGGDQPSDPNNDSK
jgi:hypothetical protein